MRESSGVLRRRTTRDDDHVPVATHVDLAGQCQQTSVSSRGFGSFLHGDFESVPVPGRHVAKRPALFHPNGVEPFAHHWARNRTQPRRIDDHATAGFAPQRKSVDLFDGKAANFELFLRRSGESRDGVVASGIEATSQQRQETMSDAIAGIAQVVVRPIFPERLFDRGQVGTQFRPRDFQ